MKSASISYLVFLLLLASPIWAREKVKKKSHLNTLMHQKMINISGIIRDLGPYIASESEFTKEKNKNRILNSLNELTNIFKSLKTEAVPLAQGSSLSQSIMTEQLQQTAALYRNNKRSEAWAKFSTALILCINYYAQVPEQDFLKLFQDKDIAQMKLNVFEKAELYFISRDYEKALSSYDQFLLNSKKRDDDEFILKALERELIYFVRIKKSFSEGKTFFDKYLAAKIFNEKISEEVSEWSRALSGKSLWENYDPEVIKEEQMEKFMQGFISDDEEGPIFTVTNSSVVYDLNLATILLDYYNTHPSTKLGGRILYWLSILDRRINDDLFSAADFYLLSCMEKYRKDPIASECYEAYEEELTLNYITKDKRQFPHEVKTRLNKLKNLINYKDI